MFKKAYTTYLSLEIAFLVSSKRSLTTILDKQMSVTLHTLCKGL